MGSSQCKGGQSAELGGPALEELSYQPSTIQGSGRATEERAERDGEEGECYEMLSSRHDTTQLLCVQDQVSQNPIMDGRELPGSPLLVQLLAIGD